MRRARTPWKLVNNSVELMLKMSGFCHGIWNEGGGFQAKVDVISHGTGQLNASK